MATHDYVIANGTGAAVRSDLNNALAAIVSNNSGSSEPATTYAYQWWADTTANVLKIRNSANNAWITLRELDGTILMEDGTAGAPGLAFAADLDTGILRPGDNQINFATAGAERLSIGSTEIVFNEPSEDVDFRVESNGQTHMLFVDAGNDRVGIGTSSPGFPLAVRGTGSNSNIANFFGGTAGRGLVISTSNDGGTGDDTVIYNATQNSGSHIFQVDASEKARFDSNGRLLMGHSSNQQGQLAQISTTNGACLGLFKFAANDDGSELGFAASRNASVGSHTVVNNGDFIGRIFFRGSDGDEFVRGAEIGIKVDGTPGDNSMPGRIEIATTPSGQSTPRERVRIDSSGNVGIGKTSSGNKLEIEGEGDTKVVIDARTDASNGSLSTLELWSKNGSGTNNFGSLEYDGDGSFMISSGGSAGGSVPIDFRHGSTVRARIDTSGRLLVGTTTLTNYGTVNAYTNSAEPGLRCVAGSSTGLGSAVAAFEKHANVNSTSQVFVVFTINSQNTGSGQINANGASQAAFGGFSDRRLKENIVDLPSQLDNVCKLRPVEFDYIESAGGGHQTSFIAQEFEEVFPDAISEGEDGMKILTGWGKTEAILVKALQEAVAKIEILEAKVAALEAG